MDEHRSTNFEDEYSLNHDLKQLKDLDNLLKCGICREYFDTCVVTDCSHNFCSLCIRKYIQYKTECPVCFHQLYDSQLRANRIIDNFVDSFPNLKDSLIRRLRTLKAMNANYVYVSPSKVLGSITPSKFSSHSKKVTENSADKSENEDSNPCSTSTDSGQCKKIDRTLELNNVVIPKMFQSPIKRNTSTSEHSKRNFVPCPVCQVEIPESSINLHLDDCLNRDRDEIRKKHEPSIRRKHLPKLVYRFMNTNQLRSKLKEQGLNSQGDFEMLKARLQKYTALYNAECDKTNPRPIQDIVRQVEKEEKIIMSTQKSLKSPFTVFRDDAGSTEKQNEQYLKENKESFQTLISNLQSRSKINDQEKISAGEEFPLKKSSSTNWDCRPSTSKLNHEEHYAGSEQNSGCQIDKERNVNEIKIKPVCNFNNEFVKDERCSKKSSKDGIKEEEQDLDEIKIEPVCKFENDSHELSKGGVDAIDLCDVNLDAITTSPVIHKRNTKKRKCNEETSKRNLPRRKK